MSSLQKTEPYRVVARLVLWVAAMCAAGALNFAEAATIVESWDSGAWAAGWVDSAQSGTVRASAAHDGSFGVVFTDPRDWWTWNSGIIFTPGSVLSLWVRPHEGSNGQIHLGFGADATGASSFVVGTETNQIQIERNPGYSFSSLAAAPLVLSPNQWHRLDLAWLSPTTAVGSVFASDGVTVLNSITQTTNLYTPGTGVALRGFGFGAWDADTLSVSAVPEPPAWSMALVGMLVLAFKLRRMRET